MALPSSEMVRLIRQSIFSKKEKKIGLKCGLGISDQAVRYMALKDKYISASDINLGASVKTVLEDV